MFCYDMQVLNCLWTCAKASQSTWQYLKSRSAVPVPDDIGFWCCFANDDLLSFPPYRNQGLTGASAVQDHGNDLGMPLVSLLGTTYIASQVHLCSKEWDL